MSAALPSDEVAEDYKNSLEDLTMNSKYEISNLTVIAKENTEHGMAISRVLENHIRETPPERKLPALYVLDSIVKNVGTPYTLFLGRNLYQTFMDAYSLVNGQVRKKLDEMLKTWKEPVPGSSDTRPVFPVERTRPIENALIKARTVAVQQQQQQARSQQDLMSRVRPTATPPGAGPWRNTPTPPQGNGRYPPASTQVYTQSNLQNGHAQTRSPYPPYPQHSAPPPTPQYQQNFQHSTTYPPQSQPQRTINLDSLHRDLAELISAAQNEFAANPWEPSIQDQLRALLELQNILKSHQLPPNQIQQVRDQVSQLHAARRSAIIVSPPAAVPPPPVAPPSVPQQQPDLQALMSSNTLAQILASAAQSQQQPPGPPATLAPVRPLELQAPQPPLNTTPTTAGAESSLMASLRAAGILPSNAEKLVNGVSHAPRSTFTYPPPQIIGQTPPIPSLSGLAVPAAIETRNDVRLTSASLKINRPHLLSLLYEARPNQCSTCGRRFLSTKEGREKKARHLDWHFRTNQRLADSARRGQSRSWYVDEMEWIKSRDNNEEGDEGAATVIEAAKALAAATAAKNDPKNKYIIAPNDSAQTNTTCPICQEKFAPSWNDEAQDFVWMDAIKIGAKVYHATCYAEVKKDGGNTPIYHPPQAEVKKEGGNTPVSRPAEVVVKREEGGDTPVRRISTPDSILGKRKADLHDSNTLRSKMTKEIPA